MSTICPIEPLGVGFVPGPPENGMPPLLGCYDLFNAWEAELGHSDLIRDILLMQWNLKVQPIPNYSLGMALQVYILIRSQQIKIRNRSY